MTPHQDRPVYETKRRAMSAARSMQTITKRLYRLWSCRRCNGRWHVADWDELAGGAS